MRREAFYSASGSLEGEERAFSEATSSRRSGSELIPISESGAESTESTLLHLRLQVASALLNANNSQQIIT